MEKFNKFYASIILFLVGGVILNILFNPTEGCGSPNVWSILFFVSIYIFLFILIIINAFIKFYKRKEKFNFYPIITTLLIGILITFFSVFPSLFASKTLVKAELPTSSLHSEYSITLRANNTFKIILKDEELNCRFTGKYILKNDTLNLLRPQLQTQSDYLFGYKYLLDSTAKVLYPIKELDATIDSSKYLKIILDNRK